MNEKEGGRQLTIDRGDILTDRERGREGKGKGGRRLGCLNGAANIRKMGLYNRRLSMGNLSSLANVHAHVVHDNVCICIHVCTCMLRIFVHVHVYIVHVLYKYIYIYQLAT